MLKILPASKIKALDAYTIEKGSIASIDLMERACRAFVNWYVAHFNEHQIVGIICGTGNNGGDGLGVARMLQEMGYVLKVWVIRGSAPVSGDFTTNLDRAHKSKIEIIEIEGTGENLFLTDRNVLIDALFGSGLSRPVAGVYEQVIGAVNKIDAVKVAIDIPSGLMADSPSDGISIRADFTVSFQLPKLCFFLPQYHSIVGDWTLVDIGLNKDFIKESPSSYFYITQKDPRKLIRRRTKFEHKGDFGHALIVAGSFGKMGAAILASRAALRAGLGLLSVHVPREGYSILQTSVPEAMATVDAHSAFFTEVPETSKYSTIGIGPGLGNDEKTVKAFATLLKGFKKPMVIDADGLNILAENRELFDVVPGGSILTPHPKEFERLVGKWSNDFERLEKQKQLASRLKSVVVLKGAYTSIASPDGNVCFNSTGNPGMATGGTGDVLTGILTGLMAQQYDAFDAAKLGVYLHGLAGDLAVPELGMNSLIASDLIHFLPSAFLRLHRE